MAALLLTARGLAATTRATGQAVDVGRHTAVDARCLARRFVAHEDLVLRFVTRPDLDIFTNNEPERTIRPVKVQQRSSGGCWRTLTGLAGVAVAIFARCGRVGP